MKKLSIFVIIVTALILLMLSFCALNASAEIVSGNCGKDGSDVTWTFDTSTGILVIKGSGSSADYSKAAVAGSTAPPWRKYAESIKTVSVIGLTEIGDYSFAGCSNLTVVSFPEGVKVINKGMFYGCTSLAKFNFPTYLEEIEDDAFYDCRSLKEMFLKSEVKKISLSAFKSCSGFESIVVADQNTVYRSEENTLIRRADNALIRGNSLFIIPDSVQIIEENALSGYTERTVIEIPDRIIYMGYGALADCIGVKALSLPFVGDSRVGIDGKAEYIPDSKKDDERNKLQNCLWYVFGDLGVPESLKKVSITDSKTLGLEALSGLASLEYVILPNDLIRIDSGAFYGCTGLKEIAFPLMLVTIGDSAFYNCSSLGSIVIPESTVIIGDSAFAYCSSAKTISIGRAVTDLGDGAFVGCISSESVNVSSENKLYYSEGNCVVERSTKTLIFGCNSSTIPQDIVIIGSNAFKSCSRITEIALPATLKRIEKSAFQGCIALKSLSLPDGLEYIGELAFADCRSLPSIQVPDSVTYIGNSAFKNCTSVNSSNAVVAPIVNGGCSGGCAGCSGCSGCSGGGALVIITAALFASLACAVVKRKE